MPTYVCMSVNDNCWNFRDSYGEICVGCGCCSKDKATRYRARIEAIEEWINEAENFNHWSDDEELRQLQEKNINTDTKCYKRWLRYYRKRMKDINL